jgi:hypothetical protein
MGRMPPRSGLNKGTKAPTIDVATKVATWAAHCAHHACNRTALACYRRAHGTGGGAQGGAGWHQGH